MLGVMILFIIILQMQLFTGIAGISCLAGIIFYTVNEYVTHRFLFHMKLSKKSIFTENVKEITL